MKYNLSDSVKTAVPSIIFLLYCKFASPLFRFVFGDLLYNGVLRYDRPLIEDMIFVFAYTACVVLANLTAVKVMEYIVPYLKEKGVLDHYCPSMKHVMFYTQLISLALIIIVPHYFLHYGAASKLWYLYARALPVLLVLSLFAYIVPSVPEKTVDTLWVCLSVLFAGAATFVLDDVFMVVVISIITMGTMHVQEFLSDNGDRLRRKLDDWLVDLADDDDWYIIEDDEDDIDLPFDR